MSSRLLRITVAVLCLVAPCGAKGTNVLWALSHTKKNHRHDSDEAESSENHHNASSSNVNSNASLLATQRDGGNGDMSVPSGLLFYSFFVSMKKSAGYALPFANKVCYMAKRGYPWMLDVVPKDRVPMRPASKNSGSKVMKMAPTWYKPGAIAKWLPLLNYLVYLDMDLVVKDASVDFVKRFVGQPLPPGSPHAGVVPDLVVTDHNRILNNGLFVLRNSAWANKFVARWVKISNTKFPFPFSDNGSFIETLLSFLPAYADSNHKCMAPHSKAGSYLDCACKYIDAALGPFKSDGSGDRFLKTSDGGLVHFVAPQRGFNSHYWDRRRPGQGWAMGSAYPAKGGFILHTKEWEKEVPKGSDQCVEASRAPLTTDAGEHLYGPWGTCRADGGSQGSSHCRKHFLPKKGHRSGSSSTSSSSVAKQQPPLPPPPTTITGEAPGSGGPAAAASAEAQGQEDNGASLSSVENGSFGSRLYSAANEALGAAAKLHAKKAAAAAARNRAAERVGNSGGSNYNDFSVGGPSKLPQITPPLAATVLPTLFGSRNSGEEQTVQAASKNDDTQKRSAVTGSGSGGGPATGDSRQKVEVCQALPPLSSVRGLAPHDRVGVVAVPKTATTSLTALMLQAGLESGCGSVLWQPANRAMKACPKALRAPVKLQPYTLDHSAGKGGGKPLGKPLKHLLHTDYGELLEAWLGYGHGPSTGLAPSTAAAATPAYSLTSSLGGSSPARSLPRLRLVVVLRDPTTRLYSAYVHGKQMHLRNRISKGTDSERLMKEESMAQRADRWRRFYWSYRDFNNTVLEATNSAKNFEEFAAIRALPTHNQQTRMMAGTPLSRPVDDSVLKLAQSHLCQVECVGVLENLAPLVACVSKQFAHGISGSSSSTRQHGNGELKMTESNSIKKHTTMGVVTTKESVTPAAAAWVAQNSWADAALHAYAAKLVKERPN